MKKLYVFSKIACEEYTKNLKGKYCQQVYEKRENTTNSDKFIEFQDETHFYDSLAPYFKRNQIMTEMLETLNQELVIRFENMLNN